MAPATFERSARKKQMWLYAVAVLFCADFVFYGYMPSHKRLQSLREARVQQTHMIQAATAQSQELPALKTRLKDIEQRAEQYDALIPEGESLGVFLQEIARIMTKHRLTDQVVAPGQEKVSGTIWCRPVHVNCTGSLKDMSGFFHDFQAMDRLVRIQKVTFQNDSRYTGKISMEADAVIFYRSPEQEGTRDRAGGESEGAAHGA